jgi:nucleoside-diphosphate-sugar epimerase
MKIFITGATGFIGSHILKFALSVGYEIIALRRTENSKPKFLLEKEPKWICKNLSEIKIEDLQGVEVIIHLAAHSANVPYDTLANCVQNNVFESLNFFEVAKKAGVKNYVVAGSCFEYGKAGERFEFIPIDCALEPTNNYAMSKAISSMVFKQFAIENSLSLTYIRLFQVFGDGEDENRLWPSLRKAAINGLDFPMTLGEQIRDFVEVEMVAARFIHESVSIINSNHPKIKYINLGSGLSQSILDFSKYWWNKWNANGKLLVGAIPYRKDECMRYVPEL